MKAGLIVALIVVVVASGLGAVYIVFTDMINERLDQVTGMGVAEIVPKALDPKFRECKALVDEMIERVDDTIAIIREAKSGELRLSESTKLRNELRVDLSIFMERTDDLGCYMPSEGFPYSQYITSEQKERLEEKLLVLTALLGWGGGPQGTGTLGDEHEHASILVKILGDTFDFSGPSYQVQSSWMHFESQDGATIHRHASGVTMGYMFDTLGMAIDEECYLLLSPGGHGFCTDGENTLKYYVNGERVPSITDYVPKDEDRILITYGSESAEIIEGYLADLDAQPILG